MAYELTRRAADDIAHIYIEGLSLFSVEQADTYHAEMEVTFDLLSNNPHLARERTEINPPVRVHPFQSHMIIYTVDDEKNILIIRVRHGREDWKHHPIGG